LLIIEQQAANALKEGGDASEGYWKLRTARYDPVTDEIKAARAHNRGYSKESEVLKGENFFEALRHSYNGVVLLITYSF
jgi:hypothetical protein